MYPLARNQYINNSPGIFSCIRAGANTGATCIRTEMNSFKNLANMRKMIPQKYFPVFARVRIQAPHVFTKKLIPQEFYPACIGFVPGGMALLAPQSTSSICLARASSEHFLWRSFKGGIFSTESNPETTARQYHLTENYYIINSETKMDVNNYIPFSVINSHAIDVM